MVAFCSLCLSPISPGQNSSSLSERLDAIMKRPEFLHSSFGIEFYSLDNGKVIYQHNPDKLMVPGSTTKLLTEGTLVGIARRRLPLSHTGLPHRTR